MSHYSISHISWEINQNPDNRVLVYRGICHRALGLSGILQSGFWFIGEFVIGVLVYRGFGYRAFDLSGFCYRANGHRAFGYRPYVVLPITQSQVQYLESVFHVGKFGSK